MVARIFNDLLFVFSVCSSQKGSSSTGTWTTQRFGVAGALPNILFVSNLITGELFSMDLSVHHIQEAHSRRLEYGGFTIPVVRCVFQRVAPI